MNPIDENRLITIADILSFDESSDSTHCVLGVVRQARYQEIPSKKSFYENYCLLDMEIADHTCAINTTLPVRLWGNITKDHLRHRFVEGSIVMLVGVHLQHDKYKDKLILQQRGYNSISVSYVRRSGLSGLSGLSEKIGVPLEL